MYDYIIVGAGSAGCVVAEQLTRDHAARVLLLEAGGADDDRNVGIPAAFSRLFVTDADWGLRTVPQRELDGRRLRWPRGKVLGGSSSVNAMMWVRGVDRDYDAWAAAGNSGWAYDDVAPVLDQVERRLGDGAPLGPLRDPNPATALFVAACVRAGMPFNPAPNLRSNEGVAYTSVTQRNGRRWSAADAWLRPALRRPNLHVLTGASATRIVCDRQRAVGVEYVRDLGYGGPGNRTVRHRARTTGEVVLCGGAVASPQLLQVSGIGPADDLTRLGITPLADLPAVGRNLRDHLAAGLIVSTERSDTLVAAERPDNLLRYLLRRRGPLASNVAEAHAFVRTDDAVSAPDIELIFATAPYLDHGQTDPSGHGYTVAAILLQPASAGTVTLASSDPLVAPRIDPRYLTEPADLDTLTAGIRRARDVLATRPLAGVVSGMMRPATMPSTDADIRAAIRAYAETLYHPVGTCRMGPSAGEAVVDDQLRVHGIDGLRVADASIMPTITRGHTHAPALMIGQVAADLIRGQASSASTVGSASEEQS